VAAKGPLAEEADETLPLPRPQLDRMAPTNNKAVTVIASTETRLSGVTVVLDEWDLDEWG